MEPTSRMLVSFSNTRALKLHVNFMNDIIYGEEEHGGAILPTFPNLKLLELDEFHEYTATNPQRLVAIALCHTKDSVTRTHSSVDEKRGKRRYRVADRKKIDGQNILLPSLSPQVSLSFCLRGARPVDGPSRSRERRLPAGLDRVSF